MLADLVNQSCDLVLRGGSLAAPRVDAGREHAERTVEPFSSIPIKKRSGQMTTPFLGRGTGNRTQD